MSFLTNALPLLAFCDDTGWRPMPFIPWHQPWFNEAGVFTASVTLPADEVLACPAVQKAERVEDGWRTVEFEPFVGRDFSLVASRRYREYRGEAHPHEAPPEMTIRTDASTSGLAAFALAMTAYMVGTMMSTPTPWFLTASNTPIGLNRAW